MFLIASPRPPPEPDIIVERGKKRGRARDGGGEDGVLEADALAAAEAQHLRVDVR
jgi:hypothetical protein